MLTKEQQHLVSENEKLIFSYMNRFGLDTDDVEDWYGVLALTLCKAACGFDESKGYKFSTYVWTCFSHEVWNLKNRERSIKCVKSLDEEIPDTEGITFAEVIPSYEDMEDEVIQSICNFDNDKLLYRYNKLKPLHKEIIYQYFINYAKQTDIAEKVGVSRQRISKICCDFINNVNKDFETVNN